MTTNNTILIVEDDSLLSKVLVKQFNENHFEVYSCDNGKDALGIYHTYSPHIILMDIDIPEKNGWEVLGEIRTQDTITPIFMITGKNLGENDSLKSYELGATLFIRKPLPGPREILALVEAQSKMIYKSSEIIISCNLKLNMSTLTLETPTETHILSEKQTVLLSLLLQNKNQITSKEEIHKRLWGFYEDRNQSMLKKTISELRKMIEPTKFTIISVHNKGYMLCSSPENKA